MKSLVFAFGLVLACAAPAAVEFSAGFARVDITPPLGCYISGYYKARYAKSVLDPLQINCVAFRDGQTKALVMQIDTVAVSDHVYNLMRDAIAKATGVARDAIFLHASHTHDGGPLRTSAEQMADGTEPPLTRMYRELCTSRATDAISTFAVELISPMICTIPVVTVVSQAT